MNQTPIRDEPPPAIADGGDKLKGDKVKGGVRQPPPKKYQFNRAPLTSWEEYAQALLQANETSFVN